MSELTIQRGALKSNLDATAIKDGSIYFVVQDGGLYFDVSTVMEDVSIHERIKINDKTYAFMVPAFSSSGVYQHQFTNLRTEIPYKVDYDIIFGASYTEQEAWALQSAIARANIACAYDAVSQLLTFSWDKNIFPPTQEPIYVVFYITQMELIGEA